MAGTARLSWSAKSPKVLTLVSENFDRPLLLHPPERVKRRAKIGAKLAESSVDSALLLKALKYVCAWIPSDTNNFDVIQMRSGGLIGGSEAALALFAAPSFKGLSLAFHVKFADRVLEMLELFGSAPLAVAESENFYVFSSEAAMFGFEKTKKALPSQIENMFANATAHGDLIRTRRADLLRGLAVLSSMNAAVRLRCNGFGSTTCTLVAQSADRIRTRKRLEVYRVPGGDEGPIEVRFDGDKLKDAALAFTTPNIEIRLDRENNALMVDESETDFQAAVLIAAERKAKRSPPKPTEEKL
jgi:hypothetical protein